MSESQDYVGRYYNLQETTTTCEEKERIFLASMEILPAGYCGDTFTPGEQIPYMNGLHENEIFFDRQCLLMSKKEEILIFK